MPKTLVTNNLPNPFIGVIRAFAEQSFSNGVLLLKTVGGFR
jgi:hypothetical protein